MLGILHAGGFTLQTIGLQYTTVARSSFITGIAVVLVPFVYWLVEKRSITIIQWVGVLCVGIGLYIFTDPNFDAINKGDALTIGCSAFWSFYIVLLSRFTLEDSTTEHTQTWVRTARLVGLQLLTIAVVSVSGMLIFEDVSQLQFSPAVLYGLAYTSLLATVFNTAAHTHVQRLTTAVKAGLIFSLEPVFASFLGVIALGEAFGMREISGGILVIAGVLTSEVGSTFLQRFRKAS
jgi:drug/metabolite transporter (DMT)-like permease